MADKTKTPLTVDTTPAEKGAGEPLPTFTEIANNPKGITSRSTVAKLLEIHVLTLTLDQGGEVCKAHHHW